MRIKMLETLSGVDYVLFGGSEYDIPDKLAAHYIHCEIAVRCEEPKLVREKTVKPKFENTSRE